MNTKSSMIPVRNLALAAIIILSASCLDYTVKTSVNKDGSIFRQYSVRGDSAEIFDGSLTIPSGDPWLIEHRYEPKDEDTSSEKSQYVYQASRTFINVKELNDWLSSDTALEKVNVRVDLHKKFRWFYTYYEYSEVFPMSFPFNKIPVDSFLTELEQSILRDDGRAVYSPSSGTMIWKKDTAAYQYSPSDSAVMKKIAQTCEEKMVHWMAASFVLFLFRPYSSILIQTH